MDPLFCHSLSFICLLLWFFVHPFSSFVFLLLLCISIVVCVMVRMRVSLRVRLDLNGCVFPCWAFCFRCFGFSGVYLRLSMCMFSENKNENSGSKHPGAYHDIMSVANEDPVWNSHWMFVACVFLVFQDNMCVPVCFFYILYDGGHICLHVFVLCMHV